MYHIKADKRAKASVELICKGLLECLDAKPFDEITITDIQRVSTVSRSTFYRNFDCLEDVLSLMIDRGFEEIFAGDERISLRERCLRYWVEHDKIMEALIPAHRTDLLFNSLRRSTANIESLQFLIADPKKYDYFMSIVTSVMTGILVTWVERGKQENPDELIKVLKEDLAAFAALGMI